MSRELKINSAIYRDMALTAVNIDSVVQLDISNAFWSTSESLELRIDEAIQLRDFLNEFIEANNE